jgi:glutamate---cysteine ligase / carboxylate-amine ligase
MVMERHLDADLPDWATWQRTPWTSQFSIGIEEELMLLDPADGELAFSSDTTLRRLPEALREKVTLETHAAVLEVATGVHRRVCEAAIELGNRRAQMARALADQGVRAAVAGTHPSAVWNDTVLSEHPRFRGIGESMRVLARREPTLALHVHVGIATANAAVRVLNGLRAHLPLLLALSANSPFWQGRETGFASTRTTLFQAFPRSGVPRSFRGYRDWVGAVNPLVRSGAIADPSFIWWDVRLQPRYGTVEVRIMDGQTAIEDVAALAALVQSLARWILDRPYSADDEWPACEVIDENRFLAARDGMDALLIDLESGELVPALVHLEKLVEACRPHAEALGCARELSSLRLLAASTGAARQLAAARRGDLRDVTAGLASAYCPDAALGLQPSRRAA